MPPLLCTYRFCLSCEVLRAHKSRADTLWRRRSMCDQSGSCWFAIDFRWWVRRTRCKSLNTDSSLNRIFAHHLMSVQLGRCKRGVSGVVVLILLISELIYKLPTYARKQVKWTRFMDVCFAEILTFITNLCVGIWMQCYLRDLKLNINFVTWFL